MKKLQNPTAVRTLSDQEVDLVNLPVNPDYLSIIRRRKPDFFIHVHQDGHEEKFPERPRLLVTSIWTIDGFEVTWLKTREFARDHYPITMEWPEGAMIVTWSGPPFGKGWQSHLQTGIWWRPSQSGGL